MTDNPFDEPYRSLIEEYYCDFPTPTPSTIVIPDHIKVHYVYENSYGGDNMGREWLNKTEEEDFKAKVKKLGADYMEPLGYSTKHGVFIGPEIFMQNSSYFWADNEWNHRNESSGWKIALSIDSIGSVRIGVINPSCNNFETRRKLEDDEVKFLLETLTKLTAKKSSKKKKK